MKNLVSAFALLSITSLNTAPSVAQDLSENMEQLISWMTGEFDSADQAANDTAFYHITLRMTRVWPDKPNGVWLYVEQAVASTPDKPYRQRMYFVSEITDDEYSSDVYLLPDDAKAVGAWRDPSKLNGIGPFDLKNKSGCAVILFFDGFQYGGSTSRGTCKSEMGGAAYATSEVTLLETQISTWDRGYNAQGEQVWGSTSGPYIFVKRR